MSKLKILVRGPALTRSGYGHNTRYLLRALRTKEEFLDLYLLNTNWGQTGWLFEENEEREWLDGLIKKTAVYQQGEHKISFDVSYQVTIPQEWEKLAIINIGYTAGVETTKISPLWIQKSNEMNRIAVVSEHAKYALENTSYEVKNNETGEVIPEYKIFRPIDVLQYGNELPDKEMVVPLDLEHEGVTTEFNFLTFAQWGPRKNLDNTIIGFVEAFRDRADVGLVVKTFQRNYSYMDKFHTERRLKALLKSYKLDVDRKCKVYFLHGDMSEQTIAALFCSKQIHAFVNIAHGEGFGLPIFEAAVYGVPIVTIPWGGQCDFLYKEEEVQVKIPKGLSAKEKRRFKKTKYVNKPMFTSVEYNLNNIQDEAVWENVLLKDSKWAFPKKQSYKAALRKVVHEYSEAKTTALALQQHVVKEFRKEKKYGEILEAFHAALPQENAVVKQLKYLMMDDYKADMVFCSDMFKEQYAGGAELSFQTLIDSRPDGIESVNITCSEIDEVLLKRFKDAHWIFGNISDLSSDALEYLINENMLYDFVEFDYKICEYRNPALHQMLEDEPCSCENDERGELYVQFYKKARHIFFMSDHQKQYLEDKISLNNGTTLSSIFDPESLEMLTRKMEEVNNQENNTIWAIPGSNFWVKGNKEAKKYCEENGLEFVEIKDMSYEEVLDTLVKSRGFVCLPPGEDTCPRLVIEAKLLGCELVLNDNVLHKDEDWFNKQPDELLAYLKSVSTRFWDVCSKSK